MEARVAPIFVVSALLSITDATALSLKEKVDSFQNMAWYISYNRICQLGLNKDVMTSYAVAAGKNIGWDSDETIRQFKIAAEIAAVQYQNNTRSAFCSFTSEQLSVAFPRNEYPQLYR